MSLFEKIQREIVVKYLPFDFKIKRRLLYKKYIKQVRFKGENIILKRDSRFIRSKGLVLGENVSIGGGGLINATAGIMLGDNCILDKNTVILTSSGDTFPKKYEPVIIGAGNRVGGEIAPGTIIPNKIKCNGLSDYEGQIVFILSTGRSGSQSIAHFLDQHPEAECYHDSFPHVYTWSCDILYGRRTKKEVKEKILALYNAADIGKYLVHGQSDQKLAALVPILADIFPKSKFIWLIRSADSFLNSSYPRGWFDNSEFGYPPNELEFFNKNASPSEFDAAHRTNGILVGKIEERKWKKMTAFERNCWYWSYWNNLIERQLSLLSADRSMMVRLNELSSKKHAIVQFLGLNVHDKMEADTVNTAKYKKLKRIEWTEEMETLYKDHCEAGMQKWFS